jgi:hypothetical protein
MKTYWMAAAVVSAALTAGCGEKPAENAQEGARSDGTTVTVPQETGTQANLQPPSTDVSSNRDSVEATSRPKASSPARTETRPAPARTEAPRSNAVESPRTNATSPTPAAPVVRVVTIPAGTALPLEMTSAVSTATAQVEAPVTARVRRAVTVGGETVIPAGAVVNGEVSEVERAGRVQGRSRLALRFTSVVIDGRRESLRTNPIAFEGEATKSEDATKIGAGAGIGAAIGGLLGGGSGAAKGAVIGGAAGTGAVLATRGKEVELAAGAEVTPTLASPVEVEVR